MILRPAEPRDLKAVHDICLDTATKRELDDLDLIGYVFADPYLTLAPEFCFVIDDDEGVAGYAVGALDTVDFYRRWRAEWTPRFADLYPKPEQETDRHSSLVLSLHNPERYLPAAAAEYPSHLHINLDARTRRQGWGTKLLDALFDRLRAGGVAGRASEHVRHQHPGHRLLPQIGLRGPGSARRRHRDGTPLRRFGQDGGTPVPIVRSSPDAA
ncbi:hypothetical protein [Kutzneria sp. 744]|uniref:hypothetical protein n=1 Tax=Kutzneria sp. (strain 744) TaxID=345341 RepID=UPI0003EEAB52|nr:hypothetical protein [Kutzneria sp. 744]EWM12949.1 toxin-antitoxin system, toxin component [Kutzneria sp. 744]